jgi:hypothetical protein
MQVSNRRVSSIRTLGSESGLCTIPMTLDVRLVPPRTMWTRTWFPWTIPLKRAGAARFARSLWTFSSTAVVVFDGARIGAVMVAIADDGRVQDIEFERVRD